MFDTLSRSWRFARMSYHLLWEHKWLIWFPLMSTLAAAAVSASFLLPLWQSGTLEEWSAFMDENSRARGGAMLYVTAFAFYFCNYFVIVFFNTGLLACVFRIVNNGQASLRGGFSFAVQRLPQILGWALVSAVVGVVLKAVETSHRRAGEFISAILGSAWTALTYFVVPVIVLEGLGPVGAFKRSVRVLKQTWGTALVGNFSLGLFAFLLALPVILVVFVLFGMAAAAGNTAGVMASIAVGVILFMIVAAATSAADMVFKAFLFSYATGQSVPQQVDTSEFSEAFRHRR